MKRFQGLSPKAVTFLQIAVVIAITFAAYSNILFNGFVIDDSFQVTGNRWIRDIRYLPEIFSSNFVLGGKTAFYRPLVHVFYMIPYHLFGLAPWGFHLMSIVFHAGVSVLVFLTISFLLRKPQPSGVSSSAEAGRGGSQWASFAAALLFATHPVHTEAVAWISVTDLYVTFFYLLSFYLYIRSSEEGSRGVAYALSVASFFLAALCKEPALTLPAMLVVYDYVFRKEREGITYYAKRYVPFLLAAGGYFALRLHSLGGVVTFRTPLKLSPYEYLIDVLALFTKYIEKLLLPVNLNVWHVFQPPPTFFPRSGMISLFVTAAFVIVAAVAIRRNRVALLGFMFILLPLLPALYLPGLTQGLENAFTERYLYLSSFGFVLLIALLICGIMKEGGAWRNTALTIVLSVSVLLCFYGSIIRNAAWKDNYTIWADSVRKSPGSPVPLNGLGDAFREKGLPDEAIRQYLAALRMEPGNPFTHTGLGLSYADKGWPDRAIAEFQIALGEKPGYAEAHDSLGVLYGSLGQHDKAVREFEIALSLNPDLDYVYKHLGIAYTNLGMTDKAIEHFRTALRMNPDDGDAHNNLGVVYAERGLTDRAVVQFEAAVKLNPSDPSLHYNAARAYRTLGMPDRAEEHLRRAKNLEKGGP